MARFTPKVACIVLAAGRSTRMGAANKLLADVGGKPMVRHAVEAALASRARPVLVVTGHQADDVRAALAGLDVALRRQSRLCDGAEQLAEGRHPRAVRGLRRSAGAARRHAADRGGTSRSR